MVTSVSSDQALLLHYEEDRRGRKQKRTDKMYLKTTITFFAVLCMAFAVQAQRGGRRRPRTEAYAWKVDIDGDGTLVDQKAVVNMRTNMTVVITRNFDLKQNNLTTSVVMYDPSGNVAIKLIGRRRGRPPCFLTTSETSFDDILDGLKNRSDLQIAMPADVISLNATSPPMSRREARVMYRQVPSLLRFCRGGRLYNTEVATGTLDDPDTQVKSTLALDGKVDLMVPDKPVDGRPKPGGGRPKPGGGRPRPDNGFPFPRPGNGDPSRGDNAVLGN